ncbi:hypothetical protein FS749_004314 [Ceratobasidium sp. UAMH 11750]|nr:hypothetical protein FS749_004314 [Ceratobasidium sp. UAMH 11750]
MTDAKRWVKSSTDFTPIELRRPPTTRPWHRTVHDACVTRPAPPRVPADVLNVLLHLVYGFPVQRYQPSASAVRAVLPALQALGYNIHAFVTPRSELFMLLVQAAAVDPLPMYALAAQYTIEPLAVAISTLTLSGSLSDITDELAQQMGPIHLKRLFFLHLGHTDALKRLLPSACPTPPIPRRRLGPQRSKVSRTRMSTRMHVGMQDVKQQESMLG